MSTAQWRPRTALLLATVALAAVVAFGMPAAAAAAATIPSSAPVVTITSPATEWTFTANSATIGFTVNRNVKQIASETCSLTPTTPPGSVLSVPCTPTLPTTGSTATNRSKTSATTTATTVASFPNVADGAYTFTAHVTLLDGETGTASEPITVHNAPPIYDVSLEGITKSSDSNGTTLPNVLIVPTFLSPLHFPLTLTVTSQPANGTVTKNPDGISFTYTPTAAAQNNVADYDFDNAYNIPIWTGPPPATSDSFTLTASDGHGATVSHVITVPISPYYDMNDVSVTSTQIVMPLLNEPPLIVYRPITITGTLPVPSSEALNLDTSFQFSLDPSDYQMVQGAVQGTSQVPLTMIGTCASDPNPMCATPPPPSSPTSTQQIPPLPIENYYGEQSGQEFISQAIATAAASLGVGDTIATVILYDALVVTESIACLW